MRIVTALLLALLGTAAYAQEGIYAGVGLGSFDYEEQISDSVFGAIADKVSSYKVYGGFEISDYFAIEMSYGKTSDIIERRSGNDPTLGMVTADFVIDYTTTALRAVGQVPLDWGVLLAGIGFYSSESDFRELLTAECCGSLSNAGSFAEDGLMAQLGIEWRFGRFGTGFGVRLEYEWWDISDVDASTVGAGISYRF